GTWVHASLRAEGGGVSGFDDISHRDGEAGQEGRLDGVGIRVGAVHGVARRGPRVHFDGAPIHVDDPVLFYAVASVQTAFGGGVPVSRRRRHDLDDEVGRPLDTLLNDVAVIVEDDHNVWLDYRFVAQDDVQGSVKHNAKIVPFHPGPQGRFEVAGSPLMPGVR